MIRTVVFAALVLPVAGAIALVLILAGFKIDYGDNFSQE